MKKKKLVSLILALCSVFCIISATIPASAAANNVPRTYVSIWRDGKYVDVVAWYEEDGSYYLETYADLNEVFPTETAQTYFIGEGPAELGPYAKKYGYTMTLESVNKLLLTKGSSSGGNASSGNTSGGNTSGGGEVTIPRTYLTVYKADKYVNITAWTEEDGTVYLSGYDALCTLFPEETSGMSFTTVMTPVGLKAYAKQFGYTYEVKNKCLYVSKNIVENPEKRTDLKVYRDGTKLSSVTAWQTGNTVYVKNYTDLFKIFATETKDHKVPNVKGEVELAPYAKQFGCSISITANGRLNITTEKVSTSGVEIWINGEKLAIPKNIPEPYVKDGTTLVPVRLVTEALGAEVNWYSCIPHDIVTVTREGVELYIQVGTKYYTCNGKSGEAGTETVYKTVNENTSTMLPLRVISEAFGDTITWQKRTSRVVIFDEYLLNKK